MVKNVFFDEEYVLQGKYAQMANELMKLTKRRTRRFNNTTDLLLVASMTGFSNRHREEPDDTPVEPVRISPEEMASEADRLNVFLRTMLMVNYYEKTKDWVESTERAFGQIPSQEEYDFALEWFSSFVRGGVQDVYDILVLGKKKDKKYAEKVETMEWAMERYAHL